VSERNTMKMIDRLNDRIEMVVDGLNDWLTKKVDAFNDLIVDLLG